jgi:hypothetical protein
MRFMRRWVNLGIVAILAMALAALCGCGVG